METKNNTVSKPLFTEKDVLIALAKMDENKRIWLDKQSLESLVKLVNDKEFRDTTFESIECHMNAFSEYKLAIKEMCTLTVNEKIHKPVSKKMADMVENYKGFSREERLEFYKRLVKEKTPENYTDETKYMCSNFGNVLQSALESALKS